MWSLTLEHPIFLYISPYFQAHTICNVVTMVSQLQSSDEEGTGGSQRQLLRAAERNHTAAETRRCRPRCLKTLQCCVTMPILILAGELSAPFFNAAQQHGQDSTDELIKAPAGAPLVSLLSDSDSFANKDLNSKDQDGLLALGTNKDRPYCVENQVQLVEQQVHLQQSSCEVLTGTGTGFNVTMATTGCKVELSYWNFRLAMTKAGPVPHGGLVMGVVGSIAGLAIFAAVAVSLFMLLLLGIRCEPFGGIFALCKWSWEAPFWPSRGDRIQVQGYASQTLHMPLLAYVVGFLVAIVLGEEAGKSPYLLAAFSIPFMYRAMRLEALYADQLAKEERDHMRRQLMKEEEDKERRSRRRMTIEEGEEDEAGKHMIEKSEERLRRRRIEIDEELEAQAKLGSQNTVRSLILKDLAGLLQCNVPNFLLSKLEVLDTYSDGLTCAAAYFLSSEAKERFQASFMNSPSFVRLAVDHLGLGGLMALALLTSVIAQDGALLVAQFGEAEDDIACDFAGFSISPSKVIVFDGPGGVWVPLTAVLSSLARTLCEGIPQILLQGSMLMAVGQSLLKQPLLVTSLGLSLFTSCRKAYEAARNAAGFVFLLGPHELRDPFVLCIVAVIWIALVALWLLLLLATWRVAMLQICPCHVWGISTGCQFLN